MEEGDSPALEKGESQRLIIQVFPFILSGSISLPLPSSHSSYLIFLCFFLSGTASIMSGMFSVVGGRTPMARGAVPENQGPPGSIVCGGEVKG